MYQDDASDEASRPLGIEAEVEVEVEVNIGGRDKQWPEGLIAPDRELELDK